MGREEALNMWERVKRLWWTTPVPDHPLAEEERDEIPSRDPYDELAQSDVYLERQPEPGD